MPKHYVTFGQVHNHVVNGRTLDKDTVARYDAPDWHAGRLKAHEYFGPKFCFDYHDTEWDEGEKLHYFPKGYVDLGSEEVD